MKHAGRIALAAMAISLLVVLEIVSQLRGSDFAVGVAAGAMILVWLAFAFWIAKWADEEIKQRGRMERDRDETQ